MLVQAAPTRSQPAARPAPPRRSWHRFSPLQIATLVLASIAPVIVGLSMVAYVLGVSSAEASRELALAAGENPGMLVFGAMFLATPVQWLTGRSQVRVRKYLGIVFFLLALSNGAMFAWESGIGDMLSRPLVMAGSLALLLATPLFLTSSRVSQRMLGMRRWRLLHKLTYVVAVALLAHSALVPDFGPGALLITLGFVARTRWGQRRIAARRERRLEAIGSDQQVGRSM